MKQEIEQARKKYTRSHWLFTMKVSLGFRHAKTMLSPA
jgi:hypothetical protein